MEALSQFLLKSIIVSALLTAWYLLGLRGRRLHQYNRFFLLSILFFSLTIPFLHFQLFNIPDAVSGSLAPVALFIQPASDMGGSQPALQLQEHTRQNWLAISGVIAAGISMVLLLILLSRILKVRKMCRQYAVTQFKGINLILTDSPKAPFTFLKYVFWNRSLPLQDEIGQLIFRHELAHIEQGHTYDKLACQVLTCIFWFNPFYWIIQKELNIVHEFVADEQAVANRDTEAFAMMLLQSYSNGSYLVPEHHFFSSAIKRRVVMLQNTAKPSYTAARRLIVLPLIAGAIMLFSFSGREARAGAVVPAKKKIIVLLDAGHGGKDAGAQSGKYTEKDICLQYARRIKELASAYNVEIRLTRESDRYVQLADRVAFAGSVRPNVFISLHVGDEPGEYKEKGDFDIYVSSQNAYAKESSNYSSAIFVAMAQKGIIPGITKSQNHVHSPGCNCNTCTSQLSIKKQEFELLSTVKESIYVLKQAQAPAMVLVLGNIKNQEGMRLITDNNRVDELCHAVLKGIVEGATEKAEATNNGIKLLLPPNDTSRKCR
jgi:N-acetylmuramoyl-L-alanine amidase